MRKEKLTKKIYNYFRLDKKINRLLFIFGMFFGYWLIFYIMPILFMSIKYNERPYIFKSFLAFVSMLAKLLIFDKTAWFFVLKLPFIYFGYLANIGNIASFTTGELFLTYFLFIFILVFIPMFLIHKVLPNFKIKYILLWGGGTVILSTVYIYIYMVSFVFKNFGF